jgi:hypothetical protein
MRAGPELVTVAMVMLGVYVALGIWSIAVLIRSFYKPLDATPEKAAALKKLVWIYSRLMFGAVAMAIYAVVSKQYYLLGAAALLAIYVLPIIVQHVRVRSALRRSATP